MSGGNPLSPDMHPRIKPVPPLFFSVAQLFPIGKVHIPLRSCGVDDTHVVEMGLFPIEIGIGDASYLLPVIRSEC